MIVERMHRADRDDAGPAVRVPHRHARPVALHGVVVSARPAVGASDDAHPLRAQRKQLDRHPGGVLDDLDIAIAVQQQVRRQRFDQRLPGAGRIHQRGKARIGAGERCLPDPLGDDPDRALGDRVGKKAVLDRAGVIIAVRAEAAIEGGDPACHHALGKGHAGWRPALEGGAEDVEQCHGNSFGLAPLVRRLSSAC